MSASRPMMTLKASLAHLVIASPTGARPRQHESDEQGDGNDFRHDSLGRKEHRRNGRERKEERDSESQWNQS